MSSSDQLPLMENIGEQQVENSEDHVLDQIVEVESSLGGEVSQNDVDILPNQEQAGMRRNRMKRFIKGFACSLVIVFVFGAFSYAMWTHLHSQNEVKQGKMSHRSLSEVLNTVDACHTTLVNGTEATFRVLPPSDNQIECFMSFPMMLNNSNGERLTSFNLKFNELTSSGLFEGNCSEMEIYIGQDYTQYCVYPQTTVFFLPEFIESVEVATIVIKDVDFWDGEKNRRIRRTQCDESIVLKAAACKIVSRHYFFANCLRMGKERSLKKSNASICVHRKPANFPTVSVEQFWHIPYQLYPTLLRRAFFVTTNQFIEEVVVKGLLSLRRFDFEKGLDQTFPIQRENATYTTLIEPYENNFVFCDNSDGSYGIYRA